jgi:hypothetical protein
MVVAALLAWWTEHQSLRSERQSALTWQLRAKGALMALEDADRKAAWTGSNVAVIKPARSHPTANVQVIYQAK